MSKSKKKNPKDSQLVLRLPRKERDAFVTLCEELDTSAAREIRRFIRGFLENHETPEDQDQAGEAASEQSKPDAIV